MVNNSEPIQSKEIWDGTNILPLIAPFAWKVFSIPFTDSFLHLKFVLSFCCQIETQKNRKRIRNLSAMQFFPIFKLNELNTEATSFKPRNWCFQTEQLKCWTYKILNTDLDKHSPSPISVPSILEFFLFFLLSQICLPKDNIIPPILKTTL